MTLSADIFDKVRQPKPVYVTLSGEKDDVENYILILKRYIESRGYDHVLITAAPQPATAQFTIHPGAVNE